MLRPNMLLPEIQVYYTGTALGCKLAVFSRAVGLLLAKPKGSRILFLLHICPAADFIGGGVQSFRLVETFLQSNFSLGLNVYNLCLYSTVSLFYTLFLFFPA